MTAFAFQETVPAPTMMTAALGTGSAQVWTDKEIGKALKLSASDDSTMVHVTGGDEIFGFLKAVAIGTVNDGYGHGSVQIEGWMEAKVGANQGGSAMAVGDWVVADTPVAHGTAGMATVKTSASAKQGWQVMRILSGTGVAGDSVLLFKC